MWRFIAIAAWATLSLPNAARADERVRLAGKSLGILLTDAALNASAALRTVTFSEQDIRDYGLVTLAIDYENSSATAVTMTCDGSLDAGATWVAIQSCTVVSGVCTSDDSSWSKTVSADDEFGWRVTTKGYPRVRCILAGTGAGASDTVSVQGYAVFE